jgi:hypothetical protein
MKASEYGIKNLKVVVKNLPEWTKEEGDRYQNLAEIYGQVIGQYNRYANHVSRNIGGVEETFKSVEEAGNVYAPTAKNTQRSAVNWLNQFVFTTPTWLLDKNILNKIAEPTTNNVGTLQTNVLSSVLSSSRLVRMLESANRFGTASYSVLELMTDLKNGIWSELRNGNAIELHRRNLQKAYIERMLELIPKEGTPAMGIVAAAFGAAPAPRINNTDLPSIARGHLMDLQAEIKRGIGRTNDRITRYHLIDVERRIENALNPK